MNEEEDRVIAVLATYLNPLFDIPDLDIHTLLNSFWSVDSELVLVGLHATTLEAKADGE